MDPPEEVSGRGRQYYPRVRTELLPSLTTVEHAMRELVDLFDYSYVLLPEATKPTYRWRPPVAHHLHVRSVRMDSPLAVILGVPAEMLLPLATGLLLLAERLRTFNIRVSRKIAGEQLRLDRLEADRLEVLRANADAIAELMRLDAGNRSLNNFSELDILGADEGDDDLMSVYERESNRGGDVGEIDTSSQAE
jgi:hypothetical protein